MPDREQSPDDESRSSRLLTLLRWAYGVAVLLLTLWVASYPGSVPGDLAVGFSLGMLWLFVLVYWLARIFASTHGLRRSSREALREILPSTMLLVCGFGLVISEAALHARFQLSETELLRVVQELPAGAEGTLDRSAGLYHVREFWRVPDDVILLRTHGCGLKGTCGFAYAHQRQSRPACLDGDLRVYEHLTGPWYEFTWRTEEFC